MSTYNGTLHRIAGDGNASDSTRRRRLADPLILNLGHLQEQGAALCNRDNEPGAVLERVVACYNAGAVNCDRRMWKAFVALAAVVAEQTEAYLAAQARHRAARVLREREDWTLDPRQVDIQELLTAAGKGA